MTEILTSNEKGNDKVIAFINDTIYKANPTTDQEANILASGLRAGSFDSTKLWDIKVNQCREIRLQDGKPFIEVFWGRDGEEQLRISDEYKRYKFFDLIKANAPNATSTTEKWNAFRAGRKPLIAFFVVLGLFLWTLYYAIQAQKGYVYYIENVRYGSLTGIVLAIASLGLNRVVLIFSALLAIALFAFIKKAKNPPLMNRIIINR
jgi:hypothetical protein